MIITCPSCSTQYSIDHSLFGDRGKTVRCFHCGYQWMQTPDSVSEPLRRLARAASMAGADVARRTPPPPRPAPRPEPEPEPEPIAEAVVEPEPEPEPAAEPEAADETPEAQPAQDAPLDNADIDRLLAAEPEPEAVQSLVDGEREEAEPVKPEDIPDPDPLPEVFTAADLALEDEGSGRRKGVWVAVISVLVLAALGAGLFFGRTMIVSLWPAAAPLYAMVGIEAERLGAGLDLLDLRNEWATAGGQKELVVSGVIANVSDQERPVPMLRIELRDNRDEVVQVYVYPPEKTRLEPGERLNFKAHVGEVMMTARRTHMLWTEELPPETGRMPEQPPG